MIPFRTLPQITAVRVWSVRMAIRSLPLALPPSPCCPIIRLSVMSVCLSVRQVRGRHDEAKLQRVPHTEGAGGERLAQGHEEVHGRAQQPQGYGTDGTAEPARGNHAVYEVVVLVGRAKVTVAVKGCRKQQYPSANTALCPSELHDVLCHVASGGRSGRLVCYSRCVL